MNEKFLPQYCFPNWAHIVASSNSKRALKMAVTDRRWFVPQVTEERQPKEYWTEFHEWLSD